MTHDSIYIASTVYTVHLWLKSGQTPRLCVSNGTELSRNGIQVDKDRAFSYVSLSLYQQILQIFPILKRFPHSNESEIGVPSLSQRHRDKSNLKARHLLWMYKCYSLV